MLHTLSNSVKPVKWQYRAKPEKEGVETRREWPKSEMIWLRYSPDHKCESSSENCRW